MQQVLSSTTAACLFNKPGYVEWMAWWMLNWIIPPKNSPEPHHRSIVFSFDTTISLEWVIIWRKGFNRCPSSQGGTKRAAACIVLSVGLAIISGVGLCAGWGRSVILMVGNRAATERQSAGETKTVCNHHQHRQEWDWRLDKLIW